MNPVILNKGEIHTRLYLMELMVRQYSPVYWHNKHSVLSLIPYYYYV